MNLKMKNKKLRLMYLIGYLAAIYLIVMDVGTVLPLPAKVLCSTFLFFCMVITFVKAGILKNELLDHWSDIKFDLFSFFVTLISVLKIVETFL